MSAADHVSAGAGAGAVDLSSVPLFPLPGVLLFPRAVLPLHIFEHRYRLMTADALAGDRLVAMALLRDGWEKNYHGRPAVEPVVCVGRILSHERLEDGKYNFLLQGLCRARIEQEYADRAYRYATLSPLAGDPVLEIDLSSERERLCELFSTRPLAQAPLARQFRQLLAGPVPTADVADLIAFHFVEQVSLKQSLLAEANARRRVRRVVGAVESLLPLTAMLCGGGASESAMN
jgi:Lon protease-like protein